MRLRLIHAWALVLSVGACSFDSGGVPDDDVGPDADDEPPPDAPGPDAQCGGQAFPFEVANLGECAIPLASGDIVFAAGTIEINTSTGRITGAGAFDGATQLATQRDGGTGVMVISGVNVTVPAASTIVVRGARPLAIVASGSLTIAGTIDASGTLSSSGPGADLGCQASAGPDGFTQLGSNAEPGGTGGGGGAYATDGGIGAHVSPEPAAATDTPGGEQHTDAELSPIHGGCSGGAGGVALVGDVAASGGGGGGGLELVGGVSILIEGVVSTSGGGGGGAAADGGGGGGGGAGGAILIQTPSLRLDAAKLTANGGAGGEGARNTGGGSPGQDGSLLDATEATGGTGVAGGNGGNGAVMMDDGKPAQVGTGSTTATAGGGGGGGGMGRIHLRVMETVTKVGGPIISPPETSSTL